MKQITKRSKQVHVLAFSVLVALFLPWSAKTQQVFQERGVDPSVRYESLKRFGPWDDRNYRLTAEDLKVLAPNEAELTEPIPAFFRVAFRKKNPNMRKTGAGQYPLSAVQLFLHDYGGYMVNDKLYQKVDFENGQYKVVEEERTSERAVSAPQNMFLAGEVRVTAPAGAAESSIKINPVNPNLVIAGSNGPGGGQTMYYSSDGGTTWTLATLPLGNTCCDPTVEWSSNGQLAYAGTIGFDVNGIGIWFYRSSDNGQTWTDLQNVTPGDPRRELTNGGSDKEFLHVDKHATSPHLDNVYMSWHDGNVMQFGRSTNQGNTWAITGFNGDPIGIGSDIATDPNGNIYYFWHAFGTRQILLKRSTDGGVTFLPGNVQVATTQAGFGIPIPSQESRQAHIVVGADADLSGGPFNGSIYAVWADATAAVVGNPQNNHMRVQVARSRDGGNTWNVATPHETTDQNSVDRWNPWLAVGRDGTVHVIYYDTRNVADRSGVDLYYSFSTDGGVTFSTPQRLTSATSPNLGGGFEFGDYNGLDHVVCQIAIYTDSRNEGGGGGDSPDVYTIGTDEVPPTVTCPPNITLNASPGLCSAPASYTAVASDACSTPSLTYNPPSGSIFNVGTVSVTATAKDDAGNTTTCSFTVKVVDNQVPIIVCPPNKTISCEESLNPSNTGTPTSSDNCGVASVSHIDLRINGSCPNEFTINRTWTAVDVNGNNATCLQVIAVEDKKPPVITCPANTTVTCDTTAAKTGFATATDNCDLSVSITRRDRHISGDCEWLCVTERSWTATDDCRNTSKCVQTITKDVTPLIEQALASGPLKWGQAGATVTLPPGRGNCVVKWLPYSGTVPTALKFDDAVAGPPCTLMSNPLDGFGHIVNPLLGEAMKLKILVRLKPSLGTTKLSAIPCPIPHFIVGQAMAKNPDVNELLRVTDLTLGNVNVNLLVPEHTMHLLTLLKCVNAGRSVCNP